MTDFDNVADNKDELLFDLWNSENGGASNNGAQQHRDNVMPNGALCVICKMTNDLTKLFILCKHLSMCTECYRSFLANVIAEQGDQRVNRDDDDEYKLECPMCRRIHKPSEVISIFKP